MYDFIWLMYGCMLDQEDHAVKGMEWEGRPGVRAASSSVMEGLCMIWV